jgi:FlaG/FlaF family flagellin (archaellin)
MSRLRPFCLVFVWVVAACGGSDLAAPPGSAALVVRTQPSSSARTGVSFDRQPVVQLRDLAGNDLTVSGVPVTAAIAANRGSLSGATTSLTDASGRAEFTDLRIDGPSGAYTLIFAAEGYTSVTADPIEIRTTTTSDQAPIAADDEYHMVEGFNQILEINAAGGVLQNDRDPDGDPLTAAGATHPLHGSVTLAPDGSFSYKPEVSFFGEDRFTYRAQDGSGNSSAATVTIHVAPVNDAPRFTAADPPAVRANAGPQTVRSWAGGISPGAWNENDQVLEFHVISNSNPGLFTPRGQPTVTREGRQSLRATLEYTPSGRTGTASITVILQDNGGTANGGNDTSLPFTFVIRVGS